MLDVTFFHSSLGYRSETKLTFDIFIYPTPKLYPLIPSNKPPTIIIIPRL